MISLQDRVSAQKTRRVGIVSPAGEIKHTLNVTTRRTQRLTGIVVYDSQRAQDRTEWKV